MINLDEVKMLHESAMEFIDLATIAKAKGDEKMHDDYLKKAFVLEKEAALKMQEESLDNAWRFILLRSAGWMAYECGLLGEAEQLVELGLSNYATGIYREQLLELKKHLKSNPSTSTDTNEEFQMTGTLASADVDGEMIKIRTTSGASTYHHLAASKSFIQQIARYLIGEPVEIFARKNEQGGMVAQRIARAA